MVKGVGRAIFALRVEQEDDLPQPPFVVAANHYSHLDPPAIGAVLGTPVRFLALEDLFDTNGLLDWLVKSFGAIRTPRDRVPVGAVRTALAALEAGDVVGVFPEGTRVTHWGTLDPKRGAAWLARTAGVPLVPVAVVGTGRALDIDNRLRLARIRIVVGRAIPSEDIDVDALNRQWADWVTDQIARYPGSETSGPPRASID